LLVSEDIFNVIFVVAGLMMLVLQFRAKLLTVLIGLAYDSISEKSPIGWPVERSCYMSSAGCDLGRSILFLNLPRKKIDDTSITPPTPSSSTSGELIQNLAITGVLVFRPMRF